VAVWPMRGGDVNITVFSIGLAVSGLVEGFIAGVTLT
jgi:hypothetical protein